MVTLLTGVGAVAADTAGDITSMVRVDSRSGRLVRRVVVPANVITPIPVGKDSIALAPEASASSDVAEMAARYGVDPLLVESVIRIESAGNRFAVSHKGAQGLMQLMPATARRFGVRNSFNSRQNIEGGVKYLRELQDRFGDLRLVLAAYNAGEEAVTRYRGIPPYRETVDYVYKVGKRYGQLRRSQKPAAKPSPPTATQVAQYRPLEAYLDQEGKLHLRTR